MTSDIFSIFNPGKIKINGELIDFTIKDLEILENLGSGAFGETKKALYRPKDLVLAVKYEPKPSDIESVKMKYLKTEIMALQNSDIPEIVTYFGMTFDEGKCVLLMEFMNSDVDSLYKKFKEINPGKWFDERALCIIAVKLLKALDYLKEERRVLHRDIKPDNVLVKKSGEVKLCDFSMAAIFERSKSAATTKDTGAPGYRAPERFLGTTEDDGRFGVRSDVWSLGITLVEIARLQHPYNKRGVKSFEMIVNIVSKDPPFLNLDESFNNGYSKETVDFINTCLTKEVSNRPYYKDLVEKDFYKKNIMAEDNNAYMEKFLQNFF
uniref:mitogen-activated protein kinase kinase n=1 Tax=Acrobeloides nanus TaxID=290746 RepID=A0A914CUV4_9BILA